MKPFSNAGSFLNPDSKESQSLTGYIDAKMVTNCRGNPAWLPILRAATWGRPYNILFVSGYAG
jgi:hypothetical protein